MPPATVGSTVIPPPGPGGTVIPGVVFAPLSPASLRPLLLPHRPPCISLTLPTHRRVPDNRVDPLRFHHLVEAVGLALAEHHAPAEVARLVAPLEALAHHHAFWEHTHEGLSVLATDGEATVFVVDEPLPSRAQVGEKFHLTDLLRLAAAVRDVHVLALTSREARLYGLTPHGLEALPFPAPTLAGADTGRIERASVIDVETRQPHRVRRALGSGGTLHGGAGDRRDDTRADTERFFRAVAGMMGEDAVADAPPVILVALPELAAEYRRVAHDPRLLPDTVALDPHAASPAAIRAAVEPLLEADRRRTVTATLDRFRTARAHGRGSADIADVAHAAVAGRVELLLLESGRRVPGRLDRDTGAVEFSAHDDDPSLRGTAPAAADEDLLGAIAATVVLHGGTLLAVDRLAMPADTGLAAIERYAAG